MRPELGRTSWSLTVGAQVIVILLLALVVGPPAVGAQDEPAPAPAEDPAPPQAPVGDPAAPVADPAAPVADPAAGGADPAEGPASTPSTSVAVVEPTGQADTGDEPLTDSERANRVLDFVIIGLLALALVVLVASLVFWRRTRPKRVVATEATWAAGSSTVSLRSEPRTTSPSGPGAPESEQQPGSRPAELPGTGQPIAVAGPAVHDHTSDDEPAVAVLAGGLWASQGWETESGGPIEGSAGAAQEPGSASPEPSAPAGTDVTSSSQVGFFGRRDGETVPGVTDDDRRGAGGPDGPGR